MIDFWHEYDGPSFSFNFTPADALSIYESLIRDGNPLADTFQESHNGIVYLWALTKKGYE